MKVKLFSFLISLSALAVFAVSCSKDGNDSDPDGTISFNMMNESNGKTELGNSDVYIDEANNFYGASCLMNDLGKKNGLGSISDPVLKGLNDKVAVTSSNAYQIFRTLALRKFPSGNTALNISTSYYNVYVVSPIEQNDAVVGANVKFALMDAPDYGLPEYDSEIGVLDKGFGDKLVISLPTSDFEYEPEDSYDFLEFEKDGNKLIVNLTYSLGPRIIPFGIYIRIAEGYTYVQGKAIGSL